MGAKHIVVQGATCQCNFGATPDKLVVKSHNHETANDKAGTEKFIATHKELGATFEKNTFGPCQKQPIPGGYKTCEAVVAKWVGHYEKITLRNKGKVLIESSKATCPIGGPDCISIEKHGQKGEGSQQQSRKSGETASPIADNKKYKEDDEQNNQTFAE